jgi:polysaccharide transporter, PST family
VQFLGSKNQVNVPEPGDSSRFSFVLVNRLIRHKVVQNAALMYVVQFSSYIFPLIALPYLQRVLSVEKFGLVAFAQTFIWYFLTVTEYGFNLTATRSIAIARESPDEVSRIFSEVMVAKLLLTGVGFLALCISVLAAPVLRRDALLYMVTFFSVLGNLLFPLWLYQGMQKMEHVALRDFVTKLLALAALFVFVRKDSDYLFAAAAQSGALFISGIVGLWTVRRIGIEFRRPSWRGVRDQFRAGWPAFLSLATSAGAGVTNAFLLGLRAPAEVAYFTGAQRIIAAMRSMVAPISTAVYPHTSQKAVKSEREVVAFVHKYVWMFTAPFLAAGIFLLVASPWVVPTYMSAKYRPTVVPMQIMALIPALFCLTQGYSTHFMLACGYDKPWMKIMLTTVIVNFAVLIPAMMFLRGSVAVALTALVVEGVGTLLYYLFYRRRSRELHNNPAEGS